MNSSSDFPKPPDTGTYDLFVESRFKRFSTDIESMLHAAVGISGEAGELIDAIKKTWVYKKPLDRANLIEELGDLEFYLQALRLELGINRRIVLEANMAKLLKRYPTGYTDAAAQARADKQGEPS